MIRSSILTLLLAIAFPATADTPVPAHAQFFESLARLCDSRFEGRVEFPEDPGEAFRGKPLVAHIADCRPDVIRIPFHVGEDRSRTWILRRVSGGGLELKHDHRHADGTPDEVTMYGGATRAPGTPLSQSFPADAHTAKLIPAAATNEWFLALSEDGTRLTYALERHGKPRFRATLTQSERASGPLSAQELKFQGTWKGGYTIVIEGREFCADTQPGEWYEGYIVIRTDEEPAQLDFVILVQSDQPNGNTSRGIFYWDGETVVVRAPTPGKPRPKDFTRDEEDEPTVLLRLRHDGKAQYPATHCLGETP